MVNKPKCIIVTGRPGAGKTTLSKRLGEHLWLPVISRDEIKEGYVNTFEVKHEDLPGTTNGIVSDFFFEVVNQFLSNKISLVIEAAFQHRVWEARLPMLLERSNPLFIICSCRDDIAADRHLQRGLTNPAREFYHHDAAVAFYRSTGKIETPAAYVPPNCNAPTIQVATDDQDFPSIESLVTSILDIYPSWHP